MRRVHPFTLPRCLLWLGLLSGCSAVVRVEPPASRVSVPPAFSAAIDQAPANQADVRVWWRSWNDPVMDALIDEALLASPDLRTAQAHLEASRALVTVAASARSPTIAAGLVGATGKVHGWDEAPWRAALPPFTSGIPTSSRLEGTALGVSAAWEADVFGGIRANENAARAAAAIAEERWHGARVLIAAEVADNYRQALALRERLAILDESITLAEALLRYVQARFAAGQAKAADVSAARARLEAQQAARPALAAWLETRLRRLAVLRGVPPQQLPKLAAEPVVAPPPAPSGELPASVLDRRPDARAARWGVEARMAQLERLKADLLPSFGIVFLGGEGRLSFSGLPDIAGLGGLLGLRVSLPLFNAGRLGALADAGDARLQAAVAEYDQTVLAALEDVENAYGMRAGIDARIAGLARSRDIVRRVAESKQALFEAGEVTRDEVLAARIELSRAEDVLAQARLEQAVASIRLYQALGGGW